MKVAISSRAEARRDAVRIFDRLSREASPRVAERFLAALNQTFQRLSRSPHIGTRVEIAAPIHAELRCTSLTARFRNYLVFYCTGSDSIDIVRILHGAQDISAILAIEEDEDGADES